jgi:hypothetical protein
LFNEGAFLSNCEARKHGWDEEKKSILQGTKCYGEVSKVSTTAIHRMEGQAKLR